MSHQPTSKPRLHHVGIAARDINQFAPILSSFGFSREGDDFADKIQGIRGQMFSNGSSRIEVLENLVQSKTLTPWISRGAPIYQLAFESPDIPRDSANLQSLGFKQLSAFQPAEAFGGRRVGFFIHNSGLIIELVESE